MNPWSHRLDQHRAALPAADAFGGDAAFQAHPLHGVDEVQHDAVAAGADRMAGGSVATEQLVTRPNPLSEGKTATGGTWKTSGQLLVIELKPSGTS